MSHPEGETSSDIVVGITTLYTCAITHFDIGASHSVISHSFARDHGFSSSPLALALRIEMPGIDLEAYICIMSFPVVLGNRAFLANLVLIPIKEFDVVLGMDWLTKHHASIDYERSTVNSRCPMKRSSFTKHVRAHSSL